MVLALVSLLACDPSQRPLPNADPVEEAGDPGCPAGMALVGSAPTGRFCIDRYEASLALLRADGTAAPWSPYHNPGASRVRAVSVAGAVPQGYISGEQAAAACAEAGKRLCSDAEWLRACRGERGWTYPYGSRRRDGACNDHRAVHPAVERFPGARNPFARLRDACINQLPAALQPTAMLRGCVTDEGVFDMMGNLHEWTSDPRGTFRGGFYVDTRRNGEGCLYATTAHDSRYWDYSTGFRCCADQL